MFRIFASPVDLRKRLFESSDFFRVLGRRTLQYAIVFVGDALARPVVIFAGEHKVRPYDAGGVVVGTTVLGRPQNVSLYITEGIAARRPQ